MIARAAEKSARTIVATNVNTGALLDKASFERAWESAMESAMKKEAVRKLKNNRFILINQVWYITKNGNLNELHWELNFDRIKWKFVLQQVCDVRSEAVFMSWDLDGYDPADW